MTGIVEFLTARLDEDEAAAKAASHYVMREKWHTIEWYDGEFIANGHRTAHVDIHGVAGAPITYRGALRREDGEHIARHDPARVLAEVKAKREIVALHQPDEVEYLDGDGQDRMSTDCATCDTCGSPDTWPCDTLKLLAAPYADHPDYKQEWSVE